MVAKNSSVIARRVPVKNPKMSLVWKIKNYGQGQHRNFPSQNTQSES
jgi:hypothetical protein